MVHKEVLLECGSSITTNGKANRCSGKVRAELSDYY